MVVSLYTSRKILEALGVEDFGIMNVVGGVISLMAIINGSMSVATQRYLTYELGKGDQGDYSKVFNPPPGRRQLDLSGIHPQLSSRHIANPLQRLYHLP